MFDVSYTPVVISAIAYIERVVACKQKKKDCERRNLKKITLFPKVSIDMAIQSQVASVNKSVIYTIMRKEKAPVYKLSHSKSPKTQKICHYTHARKTGGLFLLCDKGIDFSHCNC